MEIRRWMRLRNRGLVVRKSYAVQRAACSSGSSRVDPGRGGRMHAGRQRQRQKGRAHCSTVGWQAYYCAATRLNSLTQTATLTVEHHHWSQEAGCRGKWPDAPPPR